METMVKGMRPSKLDACIENITRTLVQRSQEENSHDSSNQTSFYKTESFPTSSDGANSLKMKIRKVGNYQTPEELKPYECPICHKRISNQANLRTHIRTHTGDKPHRCGICGKSFSRNGTLQTHLTIHSGVKLYKCEICGREIRDRGNLSKHMKIHLTNLVPKRDIGSLNDASMFIKRERDAMNRDTPKSEFAIPNSSQLEIFKKEIAALHNSQVENLRMEMESYQNSQHDTQRQKPLALPLNNSSVGHGNLMIEKGDNSAEENLKVNTFSKLNLKKKETSGYQRSPYSQDNKISYNCGLCLIAFPNTDAYFSHMMAHARDQRFHEERGPEDYSSEQATSWAKNRRPIKEELDNQLDQEERDMLAAYEKEIQKYEAGRSRPNEEFEGSFSDQGMLPDKTDIAADLRKMPTADKETNGSDDDQSSPEEKCNFKCGICGNEYKTRDSFEDHITVHKVDKPYQCTICLEQFKELRHLQKHCRSHRGLNPYWCEKCGKEFSQSIFLIEHLQRHAADEQSGSSRDGNYTTTTSMTKIPHPPTQPQGENQDMFIVIE